MPVRLPVEGITIGHYSDFEGLTGCTAVLAPQGVVASVDIRGGAPGTLETALLSPYSAVTELHGILLTGGTGLDSFLFDTALNAVTNVDQIFDFNSVDDVAQLSSAIFTAAGPVGTLAAAAFRIGASAADASDRIIYNTTNGNVYYDADGTGAAGAKLFATLTGSPDTVTHADFFIIN